MSLRLAAVLASLFRSPPIQDHDDPVLGRLTWRASTERWVSQPLSADRPFSLEFSRHKKSLAPTDDCLRVARDIATNPGQLEEQVRIQLVYAAERRPPEMRARVIALRVSCVTFTSEAGQVTGEVLLDGEPPLTNWSIWHTNGVPNLVVQHWE